MKSINIFLLFFLLQVVVFAQINPGDMGSYDPETLVTVEKTGTVIVDDSSLQPMYYLDEDNDGNADYYLNFGPFWYQPEGSNAVRPNNDDQVTISGGLHESLSGLSVLVVYEINNEFWREPFETFWNNMGTHNHGGGHHSGECIGSSFGFEHDELALTEITGVVIVDTTFFMNHYYLDTGNDGVPDLVLNFGPFWYQPESGLERPVNGETVTINGGQMQNGLFPMILVYELNGEVWLDSTTIGSHFGGGWFHNSDSSPTQFHNIFDEDDNITVNPGWHTGGMSSDSLFCQLIELYPQNMPGIENENVITGFEIGMYRSNGMNNMFQGGGCGGQMNMGNNFQMQFHFSAQQIEGVDLSSNSIIVKQWVEQLSQWDEVSGAVVDLNSMTVSFSTSTLSSYYILTTSSVTSVEEDKLPQNFSLKQNYPNPFNPSTIIEFNLGQKEAVSLTVYNLLGEVVKEIFSGILPAGTHKYNFNAGTLSSGIYLYRLTTGNSVEVKKMELLK